MPFALQTFYDKVHAIFHLSQILQNLEWDQEVMMPRKGAQQRAEQFSTLATVLHGHLADPALGDLIAKLESDASLDEDARADVREARRAVDRAVKLPGRLVAERAQACSLAQVAWEEARENNHFPSFQPHLERVVSLTREMAEALGSGNHYDALLDDFEPGMTEAELTGIFADLKARLIPLLDAIQGASSRPDTSPLHYHLPRSGQERFCRRIVDAMGFDLEGGRFDVSAHPFTNGTFRDVRLTTRYLEDYLPAALFGSMHEAGHGLYEQGLDATRYCNPSGQACSSGIHESQSRLWENFIGRSLPFWSHFYEPLRKTFPGILDDVPLETFHGAINAVAPSFIRIEADEATYNLHILLRTDLESGLMTRRVDVKDLPDLWKDKMKEYLGVIPPDDRQGVLQDVHWSAGLFGYFPTYALGNLYAAQFMETMRSDIPDLDDRVAHGDLGVVKGWLHQAIHVHGRRWHAQELCLRVTGKPLSAEPLMRHLKDKYSRIYGI